MEKVNSFEEQEFGKKIVHLDKLRKVLGILWNFEIDELFFDLRNVVSESQISTKHEFLKALSFVYDPLCVVSSAIITLKMLSQKIFMMKINWNEVPPETIITEWQNILENVNVMNSLKLERNYLKMFDLKDVEIIELHGFSDASFKVYAAAVYVRFKLKDDSCCINIFASKTKQFQIRINGICTFESTYVFSLFLKFDYKDMKLFCWTDLLDCLFWIHNTKKNEKNSDRPVF